LPCGGRGIPARMHDDAEHARVAGLIAGTEAQAARLAATLRDRCWPGGPADRSEPAARAWVRRWWPERAAAARVPCTCPHGRCVLCN
jgi:hypothetical protein